MVDNGLMLGFWQYIFPMPKLQIPLLIVLIGVIVGYVMYRRRQM